jgi:hypothetical protein
MASANHHKQRHAMSTFMQVGGGEAYVGAGRKGAE